MSTLSKFIFIFLAVLLSYIGISRDYNNGLLNSSIKNTNSERSYLNSLENVNSIYYLHRQSENAINFVNSLPFASLKNYSNDAFGNSFAIELKLQNCIVQYFSFSKIIRHSLSIQVIIFPFHFFG